MSDVKFCDSCGTGLSINAMFCHKCGQKQVVVEENVLPATDENINRETINDSTMNNEEPENGKIEVTEDNDISSFEPQPEAIDEEAVVVENSDSVVESKDNNEIKQEEVISQAEDQQENVIEPINTIPDDLQQEQKPVIPQPTITYQAQPQPQYQPHPQYQPQPSYQNAPIAQHAPYTQQEAPVPPAKKKKFPWFFTVLWLIMLAAVSIWGYFLLIDPNYKYPMFTPEAQRYVIFTVAVAVLIYTLSLKLSIKKLRAIPTILMIVLGLIIFILFSMIELQEGNFMHDTVSNLVESVIPAFGE